MRSTADFRGKLGRILLFFLIFLSMILLFADLWYIRIYGRINFDSILFTLTSDLSGTSSTLMIQYLLEGLLPAVLVSGGLIGLYLFLRKRKGGKKWMLTSGTCMLCVGAILFSAFDSQLVDYLIYSNRSSDFYEEYYQDPGEVTITFPEQKRNLIYIVLESMETTFLSVEKGGGVAQDLIPELYELAENNVNFSQNQGVGGFLSTTGGTWTIGSLVSQTGGVPLMPSLTESGAEKFLGGLTTMMDILHENGYYQALMLGSSSAFADTGKYYTDHGVDRVYDVYTAADDGIVPQGYWDGWWGMEDYYTFAYAKQELTQMAQQDQPFAFTMMTIDTHSVDGHLCPYCGQEYEEQYDNVIACSSRQVAEFVNWIREQPFGENTTVVIVGDHCSMDNTYFTRNVEGDYQRRLYNCFINSAAQTTATKEREFTTQDLFPTTLAAMGCTIEGDRLGFGTNLFSAMDTLSEQLGYDTLCKELYSGSEFYNDRFRS